MSGIYIHIPFCKQACYYCNFHFSTSLRLKEEMIDAICKEIAYRKGFLASKELTTIYFGGGTPSLLDESDLNKIFSTLSQHFSWSPEIEITLEANPDDLTTSKLQLFKKVGINRLSIGVQSFFEEDLKWMHRAHTTQQATGCIKMAQDAGFSNITIDLIYGSPTTSDDMWRENIAQALNFGIPHISSYCLTVEEKTALHVRIKKKLSLSPHPDAAVSQFNILIKTLEDAGYQHYEISNFALPSFYSVHNTSYWFGSSYLGLGPSAHSYDGSSRWWNVSHNVQYLQSIIEGKLPLEGEVLSQNDKYNEYIMTGLRTMWGLNSEKIMQFGTHYYQHFKTMIERDVMNGLVISDNNIYTLTQEGKHFADRISMRLFVVDEEVRKK
jgi:oxygen-independent coproporphyrinogen-3 oxidase